MGKKPQKKPSKPTQKETKEVEIVPHRKIYVGNLGSMDLTEAKFKELFAVCGQITEATLVITANHTFGFVEFTAISEAELAIEKMNGESGMLVKFAKNDSSASPSPAVVPQGSSHQKDEEDKEEQSEISGDDQETKPEVSSAAAITAAEARAAAARDYPNPVESLHVLVQRATRETSTSEYITYIVEDDDLGLEYVGTVEVRVSGCCTSHSGEPRGNKKEAKTSAARVALRDPSLHQKLPPLPAKTRETKFRPESRVSEETEPEAKAVEAEPATETSAVGLSKKAQQLIEKERRAAKRKATKAAKAAALAEMSSEEESSEEESQADWESEEDEDEEESEEESEDEEDSSTEVGSENEEDEETSHLSAAELAAKKAAIKAALVAKKDPRRRLAGTKSKKKVDKADKKTMKSMYAEGGSSDQPLAANYLQAVSWKTQVGPKTHIAKP